MENRKTQRPFPDGPYVLLHTLSHFLILSLACAAAKVSLTGKVGPSRAGWIPQVDLLVCTMASILGNCDILSPWLSPEVRDRAEFRANYLI